MLLLSLVVVHWIIRKIPSSPIVRSWVLLPSLIGAFIYLWITGQLEGILLLGSMIGANLLLLYLNKHNPSKQFDPGITATTLSTFTLLWVTLIQPVNYQLYLLLIWVVPLISILLGYRIMKGLNS